MPAVSLILKVSPRANEASPLSQLVQSEFPPTPPASTLFRATPFWQIAILAGLSLWLYAPTIIHLVSQWWHDPNFSHGFFVPVFAAFVIWQERERLTRLKPQPSWFGLLVLALGLCVLIVGQMGAELFLARFSLLLLLTGMIVLFWGWRLFQAMLFPLAFLLLMIPIPSIVFNQITFPLQILASKVAAGVLPILNVPILREGNVINLPVMALEVAEACSGIRSLMSLVTLAIIYGYLMEKRVAMRWVLVLSAIPISVAANSVRIIGTGLLVQYWDPDKAQGFFHTFSGWLIFVVSLIMLYLLHALLRTIWRDREANSQ
jgi:exosortase